MPAIQLPRFYPIIDVSYRRSAPDATSALVNFAVELVKGGAWLIQYRNKSGSARETLGHARELRRVLGDRVKLIMNDRVDLCLAAGFDGVHLGQDDLSPVAARKIFDSCRKDDLLSIGYSTHNPEQVRQADTLPVDYIAVGPVFSTASKANPDPVIGLEMVRQARRITTKPLVAIGGITRNNAKFVIEAGADAVAVISDVVESPHKSTEDFLRILG